MTKEKCLEVIAYYEQWVPEFIANNSLMYGPEQQALQHVIQMLPKMKQFLIEGRTEKFMRWLGFAQGVLWVYEVYTLDELMQHNRPDVNDATS